MWKVATDFCFFFGPISELLLAVCHRLFSSHYATVCAGAAVLVHANQAAAVQRVQTVDEHVMTFPNQWRHFSDDQRGEPLMQTAHMFSMVIAHAKQEHDNWTFCRSMGVRRRLDVVRCSANLNVRHGGATDLLDLGSDHWAARAILELTGPSIRPKRKPVNCKQGWWPSAAAKPKCQSILDAVLQQSAPASMNELESCGAHCAKLACQQHVQHNFADTKRWHRQDFQSLLGSAEHRHGGSCPAFLTNAEKMFSLGGISGTKKIAGTSETKHHHMTLQRPFSQQNVWKCAGYVFQMTPYHCSSSTS